MGAKYFCSVKRVYNRPQRLLIKFLDQLMIELKATVAPSQFERRTVIIMDNASIHKHQLVKEFFTKNRL